MDRCSCWKEHQSEYDIDRCFGTKEMDACSCGGDRRKCDFYPEVRNEAILEHRMQDFEIMKRPAYWIQSPSILTVDYHGEYTCTSCFHTAPYDREGHEELTSYCPHCGKPMIICR